MQLLFIFILICCALISLGLICLALLWRKAQRIAQQNAPHKLTRIHSQLWFLGGMVLGLMVFTGGMFLNLGESILYFPLLVAIPCFFQAFRLHRSKASPKDNPHATEHWILEELSKHVAESHYKEKSNFAEKNTLEMQAFGNDMYMSQQHHLQGQYKNLAFEQYNLSLPDYFTGRSLLFTLPHALKSKIFIIHKDFPCSQLLTYAGLWQKEPQPQNIGIDIDSQYTIFSKEMDKAPQDLSTSLLQALALLQQKYAAPHSYYLENQHVYVLMPYEAQSFMDEAHGSEEKNLLLQQEIDTIKKIIDILAA